MTLNEEAQEHIWVAPKEALGLPIEPYTKAVIEEYLEKMGLSATKL